MLTTQDIDDLLFRTKEGNQLVSLINSQMKKFIQNDVSLISENTSSPGIWECKWVNDQSKPGYSKGDAVWLNTQTPYDILNSSYDIVMQKIRGNPRLNSLFSRVDAGNQTLVNEFMAKCIEGKASGQVSALYCLGDISEHVQIRISLVDNNKSYPTDDSAWEDFYLRSDYSSNSLSMFNCLSNALSAANQDHLSQYHISSLTEYELSSMGFVKNDDSFVSNLQTQNFFDHQACENMQGFDYVTEWRTFSNSWYRKWKSGYVEQGGFADNNGNVLVNVSFKAKFNYLNGQGFQQNGYDTLVVGSKTASDVKNSVTSNSRYVVSVSPVLKSDAATPYPVQPVDTSGSKLYMTTDVTNMSNDGFSIVNVDTSKSLYSKYCWFAAGYVVNN